MISKRKSSLGSFVWFRFNSFNIVGIFVFIVISVLIQVQFTEGLRVSRKCPYGHYFNDGCVSCWCDKGTGHTVCEHMTVCPRTKAKCPMGRKYRDECDNECSCFESTGAIFCKEKGQCNSVRRRQTFESRVSASSPFDLRDLEDFDVPDPVYLPKDEIVIEPALIIRRKPAFKKSNNKMDYNIEDYPLISSENGHHHDISRNQQSDSPPSTHTLRKNPTLLYLYEKQLKSMSEFKNYYNHFLKTQEKSTALGSNNFPMYLKKMHPPPPPPVYHPHRPSFPRGPPIPQLALPNIHIQIPKLPLSLGHKFKVVKQPLPSSIIKVPSPSSQFPMTATPSYGSFDPRFVQKKPLNTFNFKPPNPIVETERPSNSIQVSTAPYTPFKGTISNPLVTYENKIVQKPKPIEDHLFSENVSTPKSTQPWASRSEIKNDHRYSNLTTTRQTLEVSSTPPPTRSPITDFTRSFPSTTTSPPITHSSTTRKPVSKVYSASTAPPTFYSSTLRSRPQSPLRDHLPQESSHIEREPFDHHYQRPSHHHHPSPTLKPHIRQGPTVRAEVNKPIFVNHILATHKTPEFYSHKKYIPPPLLPPTRPKQYRLFLKNNEKKPLFYSDNNKVPYFVDKIAREFFRKPMIYVPKVKNGRPLLERVVFNHKEIIPKQLILEPGGKPMKISFSPEAEKQMELEWNADKVVVEVPRDNTKVDLRGEESEHFYDNARFEKNRDTLITDETHSNQRKHFEGNSKNSRIHSENTKIHNENLELRHENMELRNENMELRHKKPSSFPENTEVHHQQKHFQENTERYDQKSSDFSENMEVYLKPTNFPENTEHYQKSSNVPENTEAYHQKPINFPETTEFHHQNPDSLPKTFEPFYDHTPEHEEAHPPIIYEHHHHHHINYETHTTLRPTITPSSIRPQVQIKTYESPLPYDTTGHPETSSIKYENTPTYYPETYHQPSHLSYESHSTNRPTYSPSSALPHIKTYSTTSSPTPRNHHHKPNYKNTHQSSETYKDVFINVPKTSQKPQFPSPTPSSKISSTEYEDGSVEGSDEYYDDDEEEEVEEKPQKEFVMPPPVTDAAYQKQAYSIGHNPVNSRLSFLSATESEYIPVSPRPGPSFEIPREEMDNFEHYKNQDVDLLPIDSQPTGMIIESVVKSHEINQQERYEQQKLIQDNQAIKEAIQQIQHKMGKVKDEPLERTSKPILKSSLPYASAEIDHDQIIREILSMDPEIGADAVLIKSDGNTVPPISISRTGRPSPKPRVVTTSTSRTIRIEPDMKSTLIKSSVKVTPKPQATPFKIPQINLKADRGIINFDINSESMLGSTLAPVVTTTTTTTESPFDLSPFYKELFRPSRENQKADALVETEGVAKIFQYDLQKSHQVLEFSKVVPREGNIKDQNNQRTLDKRDENIAEKSLTESDKSTTIASSTTIESYIPTTTTKSLLESKGARQGEETTIKGTDKSSLNSGSNSNYSYSSSSSSSSKDTTESKPPDGDGPDDPSSSFKKELDWKSQLMSNICEVNPNSPLCLTYKSLCMLMST